MKSYKDEDSGHDYLMFLGVGLWGVPLALDRAWV
jgi:hypothetical protein